MAVMALCGKPDLLVLDEPTTALDVTTQIEVLKAFKAVIQQEGASAIYVTHDLSVVAQIADQIVVLYAGRVVEQGKIDQVLSPPYHPYTRLLISSVPELRVGWLEKTLETQEAIAGIDRVVKLVRKGCVFFDRCPLALKGICDKKSPPDHNLGEGHTIKCHRIDEAATRIPIGCDGLEAPIHPYKPYIQTI